ncbi:PEP-CTERM sorting domain-containing protein [uncultured Paraglaciecola sp.]|uniref:PEP-CTERM sorting domain-containing protein n=1 Tax=uncultured Paraglaciecola sp. TaxID=1765024 RepID=UPI002602D325|nr:PEP-CTERM sorting domain-containing protein [uncultured Paraglaciecola sp.]
MRKIVNSLGHTALNTLVSLSLLVIAAPTYAGFEYFEIRNTPTIIDHGSSIEFIIEGGGDKAGLGSNDINGSTLGDITSLHIDRLDDITRFTPGSGPYVAPYLNFWITDGVGNFAVVANEPSNGAFQGLYNNGYDLSFADLSDKVVKVYENTDKSWLPNNGVDLTFADIANFEIAVPTIAELTAGWAGLGTGAPRELNTNKAYGVNWVFGDTLSNYVSGDDGYIVANARVAADVPEPVTIALFAFGLIAIFAANRRQNTLFQGTHFS